MEPVNQPAAGWYADPEGRAGTRRYWDGAAWTGHYHPPLPAKPLPPAKRRQQKWYANRWLWAAAPVVLVVAIASASGSKSPEKKATTPVAPLIDQAKLARAARTHEPFEAMRAQHIESGAQMAKLATAAVRAASHDSIATVKVIESAMTPTNLSPAVTADYMGALANGDSVDWGKTWHTYELASAYGTDGEWNVLVTTKKGKITFVTDPRVYPADSWSDPDNYGADAPARPATAAQMNYATGPLPRR